jgi:hypothetical protein
MSTRKNEGQSSYKRSFSLGATHAYRCSGTASDFSQPVSVNTILERRAKGRLGRCNGPFVPFTACQRSAATATFVSGVFINADQTTTFSKCPKGVYRNGLSRFQLATAANSDRPARPARSFNGPAQQKLGEPQRQEEGSWRQVDIPSA